VALADLDDLCGRTLGEFVLRERLDEGGFGAIYRCDQPALGREAVVKVLHQRLRHHDVMLQRFTREAQLASRLDHPYAAHVYAFGIEDADDLFWIAMERVHGITLNRWIRDHGPMPLDLLVPLFERIAEVVQAAHERGIIHRDLKPSNVMVIERAGQLLPKLLDFGVARLLDGIGWAAAITEPAEPAAPPAMADARPAEAALDNTPVLTRRRANGGTPGAPDIATLSCAMTSPPALGGAAGRLTRGDTTLGSPPYMSPEQWDNAQTVGPASDLYALAIMAYEALTGRRPFHATTLAEYDALHTHAPVPPLGGSFSPALDRVFQRALAKQPESRHRSATELAAELREALMAHPREQLRSAAQHWHAGARSSDLLLRGDAFVELHRWAQRAPAGMISELEGAFLAASRRHARRAIWVRRSLIAFAAVAALGAIQYRAALQAREQIATQAEVEQGRAALLHDETEAAQLHLSNAYQRGDHSPATKFMLARALQPRMAERARFAATSGRMWSAMFSPDGKQVVTTDDKAAQVWDARTNQRLFTLPHGDTVYDAHYTSDGARIVTACGDDAVRIWEAASGRLVRELRHLGKPSRYFFEAVSPDDQVIAAIDMKGDVARVWNASTGTVLAELPVDAMDAPSITFSSDGDWLATGGGDGVRVFSTNTWTQVTIIPGPGIRALSFDPVGPRLATGNLRGEAAVWEIPSGRQLRRLRESGGSVDAIAFSPDGKRIVTGSATGAEQIWDAASGALQFELNILKSKIMAVDWDRASRLTLAAAKSGSVAVADAATGRTITVLEGPRNLLWSAHFDAAGQRVVAASWDGTARVWDATPPYRRWSSPEQADDCGLIASLTPDQRYVAIGCRDYPTRVWDTTRDQLLAELPSVTPTGGDFTSAFPAVSSQGDRAAIARGNTVEIYELPGGRLVRTVAHRGQVNSVAFAPSGHDMISGAVDGTLLVTRDGHEPIKLPAATAGVDAAVLLSDGRAIAVDAHHQLTVYDPDRVEALGHFTVPSRVRVLRPSPDETRLVTVGSYEETATAPTLWDIKNYQLVAQLEGHVGTVYSARFVGNHEILTTGDDGTVRLWDDRTGLLLRTFHAGPRILVDATVSADGSVVVAGGSEGMLWFWDAATGHLLWKLQAHKSTVTGIRVDGDNIITRAFSGDISRWALPKPEQVIKACLGRDVFVVEPVNEAPPEPRAVLQSTR
jgi:WD40 repeat protein/serine/threonine protein kinase